MGIHGECGERRQLGATPRNRRATLRTAPASQTSTVKGEKHEG